MSFSIFLNEMVLPCLKSNTLDQLHKCISKVDANFKKSWNYLNQSCKYLSENNHSDALYKFQLFMQDYSKATFRCLNMFAESGSV